MDSAAFFGVPQDFSPINNVHKALRRFHYVVCTTLNSSNITKGVLLLSSKNAWKFEKQVAIKIVQGIGSHRINLFKDNFIFVFNVQKHLNINFRVRKDIKSNST